MSEELEAGTEFVRATGSVRPSPRRLTTVPEGFWDRNELTELLAARDVAALFRELQIAGMSQRAIALLTQQGQSEISEIMTGRQVRTIHVLEKIADGLAIPRARMGLIERQSAATGESDTGKTSQTANHSAPRAHSTACGHSSSGDLRTAKPVFTWTGLEIRLLRAALRMSVRRFASYIGVSDRMVSKWEARGEAIAPRLVNQAALDTVFARATAEQQARFLGAPEHRRSHEVLLEADQWVLHVPLDVSTLDGAISVAAEALASAAHVAEALVRGAEVSPAGQPLYRHRVYR